MMLIPKNFQYERKEVSPSACQITSKKCKRLMDWFSQEHFCWNGSRRSHWLEKQRCVYLCGVHANETQSGKTTGL